MLIKLLIISTILLIISFVFLGIRILIKANGRFPETHVGHNKEMRKRGITCAQDTSIGCTPTDGFDSCNTCGRRLRTQGTGRKAQDARHRTQGAGGAELKTQDTRLRGHGAGGTELLRQGIN